MWFRCGLYNNISVVFMYDKHLGKSLVCLKCAHNLRNISTYIYIIIYVLFSSDKIKKLGILI